MKNICRTALVGILLLSLSLPQPSFAGFWSTFFGGVAADSISGGKSSGPKTDPLIKEKQVQGALAMMGYYKAAANGDLNSLDSRIAIKAFQREAGGEANGILQETQFKQLLYLSNLYVALKTDISRDRKLLIFDEIDETIDSMKKKTMIGKVKRFVDRRQVVRIMSDIEDADVYVNGVKSGKIMLGYNTQRLKPESYEIKVEKLTRDGEWRYEGIKTIVVKKNQTTIADIPTLKNETPKRLNRTAKEKKLAKNAQEMELKTLAKLGFEFRVNGDGTVTDMDSGLVWMRCSLGQKWNGYTCVPDKDYKGVDDEMERLNRLAREKGQTQWRLPTQDELSSIVYCSSGKPDYRISPKQSCSGDYASPTIPQALFPNTPKEYYWTSTKSRIFGRVYVDFVHFGKGFYNSESRAPDDSQVRLVRLDHKLQKTRDEKKKIASIRKAQRKKIISEEKADSMADSFSSPEELYDAGMKHFYGKGVKKNRVLAVSLLKKAADQGHQKAAAFIKKKNL